MKQLGPSPPSPASAEQLNDKHDTHTKKPVAPDGLKLNKKTKTYKLVLDCCEKEFLFPLKTWKSEELIFEAASQFRKDVINVWCAFTVKTRTELVDILKSKNASIKGNKQNLVDRLVTLSCPKLPHPPAAETPTAIKFNDDHNAKHKSQQIVSKPDSILILPKVGDTADEASNLILPSMGDTADAAPAPEVDVTDTLFAIAPSVADSKGETSLHKIPLGLFRTFRNFAAQQSGRVKAYILGQVKVNEGSGGVDNVIASELYIPKQQPFADTQYAKRSQSKDFWPEVSFSQK